MDKVSNKADNMQNKLNLGCGEYKKKGYINVDISKRVNPDVVHDLNKFPYPFKDNYFDLIEADHVLEHVEDPFKVMKELNRILKIKGSLSIKVPHFSRGFTHPEHKRSFDVSFPLYFNPNFKGGYTGVNFKLEKLRLRWFSQNYLMKTVLPSYIYYPSVFIGGIIDFFANLNVYFCSRIWCFWVGGFTEIEFRFTK